jgi:hypothetical protein
MSEGKKHNILFVINSETGGIKPLLPRICADLVKKGHDVHVIYPPEINEDFEVSLRKVPWIHAQKLPIEPIFSASQLIIPFDIRSYIKRHDGISVVHCFGLMPATLSYIAKIGLKSVVFFTPDTLVAEDGKKQGISLFQRFLVDNISYVFNRLYGKVIFASAEDQKKYMEHISYKKLETASINSTGNAEELTDKLVEIYSNTIEARKK